MGWVNEGVLNNNQPWQNYKPRFFALKGTDLMLFDTPPVSIQGDPSSDPFMRVFWPNYVFLQIQFDNLENTPFFKFETGTYVDHKIRCSLLHQRNIRHFLNNNKQSMNNSNTASFLIIKYSCQKTNLSSWILQLISFQDNFEYQQQLQQYNFLYQLTLQNGCSNFELEKKFEQYLNQ